MRKDRRKIPKIPKGPYCYTIDKIVEDPVYGFRIKTKMCPYYGTKKVKGVEVLLCKYLNKCGLSFDMTDAEYKKLVEHYGSEDKACENFPLSLLWDSCKECNVNGDSYE